MSIPDPQITRDHHLGSKYSSRSDVKVMHSTVIDECDMCSLVTDSFRVLTHVHCTCASRPRVVQAMVGHSTEKDKATWTRMSRREKGRCRPERRPSIAQGNVVRSNLGDTDRVTVGMWKGTSEDNSLSAQLHGRAV